MGKKIMELVNNAKLSKWYEDIKMRKERGLTVDEWCAEQGLNRSVYYYRYKKVMQALEDRIVNSEIPHSSGVKFASLPAPKATSAPSGDSILVRLGELEVEIPSGASPASIEAVIGALKC